MSIEIIKTALQSAVEIYSKVTENFSNYYTTKSLSEATRLTRVEPLTILSKDCLNLEYTPDIMQTLLSMFSGYYLQTVNMLTKVNDIEVVKMLDRLNPDRDDSGFLLSDRISRESMSLESYQHTLPTRKALSIAMENGGKGDLATLNEMSNLAVGKMLTVSLDAGKAVDGKTPRVDININIRLLASVIPNSTITHLLTFKTDDNSVVERFHAWRSGRIGFIKDLIFCQDLIDEYKRAAIGDATGTMAEIMRRVNNAKKFGLLTGNPSLVSASNLFVITEENAREIESKLGGKLNNPRVREKAFDNTYAMIIAVVDREYERVTFYTRGIAQSTDLSIKEIKSANKGGKGIDVMDLMKSFSQGIAPSF